MKIIPRKLAKICAVGLPFALLAVVLGLGAPLGANADEADARRIIKAMSDYMAAQKAISFAYDSDLEVVTKDHQKLALLSSGTVTLSRPDKIRANRHGGFADVELVFDGKTLTLLGNNANLYAQADIPGFIDKLIDDLRVKYDRALPAADLLMGNVYDQLMQPVTEYKGSGQRCGGRHRMRPPGLPHRGSRLADLDRPGRPPLSM